MVSPESFANSLSGDRAAEDTVLSAEADNRAEHGSLQSDDPKHASKLHVRLGQNLKQGLRYGAVVTEVNHAINEPVRLAIFGTTLAETHSAMAGGAALGASTLLIEGVSALAMSDLLSGTNPSRILRWINDKANKVVKPGTKINPLLQTGLAIGVGTPTLLDIKTIADPDRTLSQNRRFGLFTASWLATGVGALGAVFGNQLEHVADPTRIGEGAIALGGLALSIELGKKFLKKEAEDQDAEVNSKPSFEVKLVSDECDVQKVLEFEQSIWDRKNYGSLKPYEKYLPQTRILAAFDNKERCIGSMRLFAGAPEVPPFVSEMEIQDLILKQHLINGGRTGTVEECGTIAVAEDAPNVEVSMELMRRGWRDSDGRGVKTWGVIMEPRRVNIMVNRYGFPFRQIGPEIDYQGGMCAPHIMDFDDVHMEMKNKRPEYYHWFVEEPLSD